MQEESIFECRPKTLAEWIILFAVGGISLTSPLGARIFIRDLGRYIDSQFKKNNVTDQEASRTNLTQAIYRLKKRKVISIEEIDGKTVIRLTEKGQKVQAEYNFDNLALKQPAVWDNRWRLLIFDIPESERRRRDKFRAKLRSLKFLQFQKSVWIYPYSCEREIDLLAETFALREYMTFLTVQIENDAPLREKFSLSL